jgi:hypothetical protein
MRPRLTSANGYKILVMGRIAVQTPLGGRAEPRSGVETPASQAEGTAPTPPQRRVVVSFVVRVYRGCANRDASIATFGGTSVY